MIQRLRKEDHAQALVEMALVLPLFLLLLFGVIEMGRVGYSYITISNAAREGGRVATIGGSDLQIESSVKNSAVNLDPMGITIIISPLEADRQSGHEVKIEVSYPVQLVIPIISNVISNPVVVSSSIVMRQE